MSESTGPFPSTRILQESNEGTIIGHLANFGNLSQIGNQTINNYHPNKSTDNEMDDFCQWLSPLDFSGSYEQNRDKVTPGTGQWFIDSEQFTSWRSKKTQNLWCYGKPGTGKSSIASIVVERLGRQAESQVAFLYLSYLEYPSVKDLLGCLASQLVRQFGDLSSLPLHAKKLSRAKRSDPPGLKQLKELLSELVSASTCTFIVVDAMDEFDQQQSGELLGILQEIGANLFVTSRNRPARGFKELKIEAHKEDIGLYIQERYKRNDRLMRMIERDASLERDIKDAITSKAAGIFLIAYFHIGAVLGLDTASEVREALKKLPSDGDSMYKSTLERIKAQDKSRSTYAMRTIGWIIHAKRPLKIHELRHALLIQKMNESNNNQFNDSKVDIFLDHGALLQDNDILEFCHGLVEVDKKTAAVRFIHFSALEYFNCATIKDEEFPTFYSEIALACVTYLCLTRLEESEIEGVMDEYFEDQNSYGKEGLEFSFLPHQSPAEELESKYSFPVHPSLYWYQEIIQQHFSRYSNGSGVAKRLSFEMKCFLYPFATHAGACLDQYFRATKESSRSNLENQLRILLENRPKRLCYAQFLEMAQHVDNDSSALFYAAFIGSAKLVELFYHEASDVDDKSISVEMALIEALDRGFLDVVKAFVAVGVMSDLTNDKIYGAIVLAACGSKSELLGYLISTLQDIWESQKQSEDTASQNNSTGLFYQILDWIADKFNSFEDATDSDPSPAAKEEAFDLDGFVRLLWAFQKGDAASILSLAKELRIYLDERQHVVENWEVDLVKKEIVMACREMCKIYNHEEALEFLSWVKKGRYSQPPRSQGPRSRGFP
ncbi:hypothetical protein HDK77DRAFT_510348 [Phyllosticta capitalensis]